MKKLLPAILAVLFLAFIMLTCDNRKGICYGEEPHARFGASQTNIVIGQAVQFSDSSLNNPNEWLWDFGDSTETSADTNPSHTYHAAGAFKVILTIKSSCGTDTTSKYINVGNVPVANFGAAKTSINVGENVQFNDSSKNAPNKWYWDFGDDSTSTQQNPLHTYSGTGTYTVTLIASNSFGSDTAVMEKYIIVSKAAAPVADFIASNTNISVGDIIEFTDKSTNMPTSWNWDFGDNSSHGTTKNPSHIYSTAGTYTVTLLAENSTGTDTEIKSGYITVNAAAIIPIADFSYAPTTITSGQVVTFTDLSANTPTSWSWSFSDDNSSSTEKSPKHIFKTTGTFAVTLTATNSAGSNFKTINIKVGKAPVAAFTASSTKITAGTSVTFTDNSTNTPTGWSWDFGDGNTGTGMSISHTYNTAGIYTVKLTVTNDFGTNTKTSTKYIIVNGAIADVDGNGYNTVVIGDQMWIKENLKTTKYNDGTIIPLVAGGAAWDDLTTPAYCWYDNNAANKNTGALYNWYTVNTGKLCPTGWHVPTDAEWTTLTNYLGGESVAGGKLKATTGWSSPNTGATNESGFTALPGGYLVGSRSFSSHASAGYLWSATGYDASRAWDRCIGSGISNVVRRNDGKGFFGISVRCVRD